MADLDEGQLLSSRDRQLTNNEAVDFTENRVVLVGEPRAVSSAWFGRLVSQQEAIQGEKDKLKLWAEVNEEKEQLFNLMEEVQKKLLKRKADTGYAREEVDLRLCSWSDDLAETQKTAQQWKARPEKQEKTMIFINKVGTTVSRVADMAWAFAYGRLRFKAAGQYSKVEEDIFKSLSEIPDIMETTRRYVEIYWKRRNNRLEKRVFDLYRSCLRALRHVMQFFADSKLRKLLEVVGKQSAYKMDLANSLAEMRQCAVAIKEEGQICQAEESHEGFQSSERTELVVNRLLNLLETHPLLQMRPAEIRKALLEPEIGPYDLANVDHTVSDAEELEFQFEHATQAVQEREEKDKALKENLLRLLQFDRDVIAGEILAFSHRGYHLSGKSKTRASLLIKSDMFKFFLQDVHTCGSLLVNGHEDTAAEDGVSPLSLVAAELSRLSISAGAENAAVFVLNFFCAEHSSPLQPSWPNSPVGTIASLICQLVSLMADKGLETDLSFLNEKRLGRIKLFDLATLVILFKKLVRKLPAGGMVLCIIDEISSYETEWLQEESNFLMEKLVRLATDKTSTEKAGFKLLVTSRVRAHRIARYFSGRTLDLPEDLDVDESADWVISTLGA